MCQPSFARPRARERCLAESDAEALVGRVLKGKWTLYRVLGVGGMAWVYAATHRNGSRAAIKVLMPEWSHDRDIRHRFCREGFVANKVGHHGAVLVLDDDHDEHP